MKKCIECGKELIHGKHLEKYIGIINSAWYCPVCDY